jgi:hypothetical protein
MVSILIYAKVFFYFAFLKLIAELKKKISKIFHSVDSVFNYLPFILNRKKEELTKGLKRHWNIIQLSSCLKLSDYWPP